MSASSFSSLGSGVLSSGREAGVCDGDGAFGLI